MNLQNLIEYCQLMNEPDVLSGVILPNPLDAEKCKTAITMRCGLLTPVYGEPAVLREMITDWFSARQWNFDHLIKVIQAEYSPIENTDKYSEHTIERDGSNTVNTSGSDTVKLSGTDAIASTGNDTTTLSGTDAIASTGTDTRTKTPNLTNTATSEISAENASAYQPDNRVTTTDTGTETDAMQHGKTDTTTYGKKETLQHGKTDTTTYGKTDTTTYGKSEKTVNDGKENYVEHTHGNIGITTNTTLISEELSLIKRFNAYDWIAERIEEAFFIMVY